MTFVCSSESELRLTCKSDSSRAGLNSNYTHAHAQAGTSSSNIQQASETLSHQYQVVDPICLCLITSQITDAMHCQCSCYSWMCFVCKQSLMANSLEGETSLQTYACMTNQTLHVLVTTVKWQVTSLQIATSYHQTGVVIGCRAFCIDVTCRRDFSALTSP